MKTLLSALASLLFCGAAFGSDATAPAGLHDGEAVYERFKATQKAGYEAANAAYREAVAAAPADFALAVAQCEFIEHFQYAEDIDWTDTAEDDLVACRKALVARAGRAPEVRTYQFEFLPKDEARALGEDLWAASKSWSPTLRRKVAVRLYALAKDEGDDEAGRYALAATELGHANLVAEAVTYLADNGNHKGAVALAEASPPPTSAWHASKRIEALVAIGDAAAARRELDRDLEAGLDVPTTTRIEAYLAGKDLKSANTAAKALDGEYDEDDTRFELALANADLAAARGMVRFDDDFEIWIERYSHVVSRAPGQAFLSPLLPFTLAVVMGVLLMALLPGVLLVPVHYRGLVRRLKNRQPPPLFERIGLRHAWIAAAVIIVVPTLVLFALRPDSIGPLFNGVDSSADSDFGALTVGGLFTLLALAPFFPRLSINWQYERDALRLRVALAVVGCWLVSAGIGYASSLAHHAFIGGDSSTLQTRTVEALVQNGNAEWGLFATWLMLGVLTPLLEEIAFRGLLLGGMSRHISFGWANALQALLFASVHADPPRFLFYLSLGGLAGWLTRRYQSILPAIALHALNNTVATLIRS